MDFKREINLLLITAAILEVLINRVQFSSGNNSPQTPLVHRDVPVLPEICHCLRVPGGRARQTPHESTKELNNGSAAA